MIYKGKTGGFIKGDPTKGWSDRDLRTLEVEFGSEV